MNDNPYFQIQDERRAMNDMFDKKIVELQEKCPHEEISGWLVACDHKARICLRCMKSVEKCPRKPIEIN